ncbi:lipopolysaccharide biosynthesis protein [Flavobacterium sp.]|uniref:lipopolysaccharide biosynthesis protein n=1 Tax=Flavobacterium sp. TaxID=239 RepID=UPI002FD91124
MIKKLFSHTFIYGIGNQIPKIAGLFSLPFITAHLTELDYGVFGVITSYIAAIEVFAYLGLRVVLINTFYKHRNWFTWVWREIYGFLIIWNFVFVLFKSLFLYALMPAEVENPLWVIFLCVFTGILFGPTATIGSTFYQIHQKPQQIALRTIVFGTLTVVFNILFIAYFKMGYIGWFLSIFLVTLGTNLSYVYPIYFKYRIQPIFKVSYRRIRKYLKVTLPTIPHFYANFLLNTSDKLVMQKLAVPIGDIGKYTAAYTVGNFFQSIGTVAGFAISPLLYESYRKKDEYGARRLVWVLQITFFIATFAASLWMKELFQLLIRNATLAATYPMGILIVMAYNYRAIYFGAVDKLIYHEKTQVLWRITFVAGVLNIISNLILIPLYGFEIAAVTTFFSLMFMGYSGYYLKDYKAHATVSYYPMAWLLATVVLTVVVYQLRDLPVLYKGLLSAVSFLVLVVLGLRYFKTALRKIISRS